MPDAPRVDERAHARAVGGAGAASLGVALGFVAVVVLLVAGVGAWLALDEEPEEPSRPPLVVVADVAEDYLAAWQRGDRLTMALATDEPPPDFALAHETVERELGVARARYRAGPPVVSGGRATVPFTATLRLDGFEGGTWSYESELRLVQLPRPGSPEAEGEESTWWVVWEPTTIHPGLTEGRRLRLDRTWPERGAILAVDGTPLSGPELPELPELPALSAQVLGRVEPLTAGAAARRGRPYVPGDEAGAGGLEEALDLQLAGAPGGAVVLVEDDEVVEVLVSFEGRPAAPVSTTIDIGIQAAAEEALTVEGPASVAVVDVATGGLRAVVSRPTGGFPLGLAMAYPPGSAFAVVTATALLTGGLDPDATVACPETTSLGGRAFTNAAGQDLGEVPFRQAFAEGCSTALARAAAELDPDALVAAAEAYGFNDDPDLTLAAFGGSFPTPSGPAEQATAAVGEGDVEASPVQMASVAATVASGVHRPLHLLTADGPVEGPALAGGVAAELRDLMRLAVAEGTASAAGLDGEPLVGVAGPAEVASPARTDAWFLGFRGGVAVAVQLEGGGAGGEGPALIAADLLRRLG
jgi:hypothetical protein